VVFVVQFTNIKGKTVLLPSKLNAEKRNYCQIMFSDCQPSEALLYYRKCKDLQSPIKERWTAEEKERIFQMHIADMFHYS